MPSVRTGPAWIVGILCGLTANAILARGLAHASMSSLTPANRVTLSRALLVCVVAALTADSLVSSSSRTALVALTVVALLLDAVDGWVARRTVVTSLGARFDLEVDAFLILVLSVYVARSAGVWVLTIGAMRYLFVVAGWLRPWLRGNPPRRYWCKVVAATQGIVLAIAAADVLPHSLTDAALVAALALLLESFGREAGWLWRHRPVGASRMVAQGLSPATTRFVAARDG